MMTFLPIMMPGYYVTMWLFKLMAYCFGYDPVMTCIFTSAIGAMLAILFVMK